MIASVVTTFLCDFSESEIKPGCPESAFSLATARIYYDPIEEEYVLRITALLAVFSGICFTSIGLDISVYVQRCRS